MTLRVAYSIRKQAIGGLYDVIDKETDEFIGEPLPWEAAEAKRLGKPAEPAPVPNEELWAWTLPK